MKHISDVIVPITIALSSKRKKSDNSIMFMIFDNWQWIVGNSICSKSFPFKLSTSGVKSTLHIYVDKYFGIEILYMKDQIVQNINSYFGQKVVDNIKLLECSL